MNRLQSRVQSHLHAATKRTSGGLSEKSLTLDCPHRLFMPEHYEEKYAYPLVIWLHSHGSSEYELDGVMPHLSLRNYVGIAVRGTQVSQANQRRFLWGKSATTMAVAEEIVFQAIDAFSDKISIDHQKIFLAGHGAGGTLAQWIGLRHSQKFAGIVSVHGAFPRRSKTLVHWKQSRKVPVLFMYGERSELCNTDEVCRSLQQVHLAGLRYQFAQFATGDDLDSSMTGMANRFMMNQIVDRTGSSFVETECNEQASIHSEE